MIFVTLLISVSKSSKREVQIYSFMPAFPLYSFGFQSNGTFEYDIIIQNRSTIIVFLTTFEEMKARIMNDIGFQSICTNHNLHIAKINSSFFFNVSRIRWKGTVESKNIYYPYILNCNTNKTSYLARTDYINPGSHLDFRDELYSLEYAFLSYVYLIITIIWIINSLLYPSFGIILHTTFACLTASRSLISAMDSQTWLDRKLGLINYDYHGNLFYDVFFVIHYTAFLTVPVLALAGWCIFRDSIPFVESASIILASFVFVLGIWSINYGETLQDALIAVSLITIGFLSYLRNTVDYLNTMGRLDMVTPPSQVQLQNKVSLVNSFAYFTVSTMIGIVMTYSITISFEFWGIVSDGFLELGYFSITVIELYLFMFCNEYLGKTEDAVGDEDIRDRRLKIYKIEDPLINDLAIVSFPITAADNA